MFESNSKLPKIFIYMMSLLALIMFVGLFFGVGYVRLPYYIAIIICVIMLILDGRSNSNLTNYKLTYLLFEVVNLIAVISIMYYRNAELSKTVNAIFVALIVVEVLAGVIDVFVLKNKNLNKRLNVSIDFIKLWSMICIIKYLSGFEKIWFAIAALVLELANVSIKVIARIKNQKENSKWQ